MAMFETVTITYLYRKTQELVSKFAGQALLVG